MVVNNEHGQLCQLVPNNPLNFQVFISVSFPVCICRVMGAASTKHFVFFEVPHKGWVLTSQRLTSSLRIALLAVQ